jgi:tetratricopeptide (TPR) repeat protein
MAFSLEMDPNEARRQFLRPDELIYRNGKTWVPLEITKIQGDFLEAWQTGAKEWRENVAAKQAAFYPTHESWLVYEPVGLPGVGSGIQFPAKDKVVAAYLREIIRFIDREIYPRLSKLQADIRRSGNAAKYVNKLGILYAKFGLTDKAIAQFSAILANQEYVPALVNLGNVHYLSGNMEKALDYYERASRQKPKNPKVLLGISRIHHELENYGMVRKSYSELKAVDANLAEQFAYLDLRGEEAARAAELSELKETVVWDEE